MEISPFYDKKIECLQCKQSFLTTKIRSRFVRVLSHEKDFKPIYADNDVNPLYYNVAVCPHCGFSFTDDFSPYFGPGMREAFSEHVSAKWNGRSFAGERSIEQAIEAYKLAYVSGSMKKEKAVSLAGITLRIAWLYREKEELTEEKRFLKIARDLYVDSYSQGDYEGTQMSEVRILYMIAELSWMIGDVEEATRSLSRVIEKQRSTTEPQIIEMAKDRWQEIREEKEKRTL